MAKRRRDKIPEGVSISDRGAVWIKFTERPSDAIRTELRDAEFHFKRKQVGWVQKATEENIALARALWERFEQEGGTDA